MLKLKGVELQQDLANLLIRIAGPQGIEHRPLDGDGLGDWQALPAPRYFYSRAASIYGGTSEVQKDILAKTTWAETTMNFQLSDEQTQLRDSVQRVLADHYGFEQRRAIAAGGEGWSAPVWRQLVELGLTALTIPEANGGFGRGAVDLLPVVEQFGRVLLMEPFLASSVLGATALRLSGDAAAQDRWLARVAAGDALLAFAHDEVGARHAPRWVRTRASGQDAAWRLTGSKITTCCTAGSPGASSSARASRARPTRRTASPCSCSTRPRTA